MEHVELARELFGELVEFKGYELRVAICGKCAMKQGYSLEERKELAKIIGLEDGITECECGRVLEVKKGILWSDLAERSDCSY